MKPTLFVGSSSESKAIAYAIQENLDRDAIVTVWTDDIFKPSKSAIDSLLAALHKYQFAALVFAPNDTAKIRNAGFQVARDNVVAELSLFIGRYGREHAFIVAPRGIPDLHLPSDFLGFTPVDYDHDRAKQEPVPALRPACQQILRSMNGLLGAGSKVSVTVKYGRNDANNFKQKLYYHITNRTGRGVFLSAVEYRPGNRLRLDNKVKVDVLTGLVYPKFPNAENTDTTEPECFLKSGDTTFVWVGIDPDHKGSEIVEAIKDHEIGEIAFECASPEQAKIEIRA